MADRLILFTTHPDPTTIELAPRLQELQLIDAPIDFQGRRHHLAGERFAEWITFLGCAPHIVTDPEAAESFCHIEIVAESDAEPRFIGNGGGQLPRCPKCRARIDGWREWIDDMASRPCPGCATPLTAAELNWRHYGGVGNLQLVIWGIPPELALPGDLLLAELQRLSGSAWGFLYLSG